MMLEHAKIDMRLKPIKGLVGKLQPFEMRLRSFRGLFMVQKLTDTKTYADECVSSGPLIKQISFSVLSNINWIVYSVLCTSFTIYHFIFDSTLKDVC